MAFARFPINEGNLTKMRLHEKMMSKQVQLLRKWLDHFYAPFLLIFIDQEPCRLNALQPIETHYWVMNVEDI